MARRAGTELFIVDNSDQDWKVRDYLQGWCDLSEAFDIASSFLEIDALLGLDDEWQKLDRVRILMGDGVTKRTKQPSAAALQQVTARLDRSIEQTKEANDFLRGVPAIVEALRSGKIQCRVYRKQKSHSKAYITHAQATAMGPVGLVGSPNFTLLGLAGGCRTQCPAHRRPGGDLAGLVREPLGRCRRRDAGGTAHRRASHLGGHSLRGLLQSVG